MGLFPLAEPKESPTRILNTSGQNPSVAKSNGLHVA